MCLAGYPLRPPGAVTRWHGHDASKGSKARRLAAGTRGRAAAAAAMGDHEVRGDDMEKKLSGWGIFGSKYEDAADLFDKAANFFKLAKNFVRSGAWADMGSRRTMEDVYICCDDFMQDYGLESYEEGPSSFYGVFDGHGGKHAADFVSSNLSRFIVEDEGFSREIEKVVSSAFLQTDTAFADACSVNSSLA